MNIMDNKSMQNHFEHIWKICTLHFGVHFHIFNKPMRPNLLEIYNAHNRQVILLHVSVQYVTSSVDRK